MRVNVYAEEMTERSEADIPPPTPGRVIQVHVADEWAVGIVLARKLEALGGKPGFIARVFDPSPDITAQDFNSMFADEHVGKTWRFPPRDS